MRLVNYEIEVVFLRAVLGTNPDDPDIHNTHVIEKERKLILEKSKINTTLSNKYLDAKDISEKRKKEEAQKIKDRAEELVETVGEKDERGVTIFFRNDDGKICIGDHMIYGFMKASAEAIARTLPTKKGVILHSANFTESIINQHVTVDKNFINFDKDIMRKEDGSPKYLIRPLRCMTAQGPRVSIAKSEQVPAGAKIKFVLQVIENSPLTEEAIREIFDYGKMSGIGQWRNAKYGSFTYTMKKLEDKKASKKG